MLSLQTIRKAFKPTVQVVARGYASLGMARLPDVKNEPFVHYLEGTKERNDLISALKQTRADCPEIPVIIGGREYYTGDIGTQVMPSDHGHAVCKYHKATPELYHKAIEEALEAKKVWEKMSFEDRAAVFLKAADLVSTKYRASLCAAVMLGTGKTPWQAEIDAAVETIDFWRFNAKFAEGIYQQQPSENSFGVWNRVEHRPLEGFVAAITPFNFCAIGSNLNCAPAQMGNVTVWKPADTAILGNYIIYKVLEEAGIPPGVINWCPGDGPTASGVLLNDANLAALHFTGSTNTFNALYKHVIANLEQFRQYPRVVGETGGKNFHMVHASADPVTVANQSIRGAFEYQGQKCSATSRMYVPKSLWPEIKEGLVEGAKKVKVGQPDDFSVFMTAVIDGKSFNKIKSFIDEAKTDSQYEIIHGGSYDDSQGYFVEPTIVVSSDPRSRLMSEEVFGPVLTVYVYDDDKFDDTLTLLDTTSKYGLTGSIFAKERTVIAHALERLRYSAGNFYINDKSTGSIVGQQPFGGSRSSGTNDKAGNPSNLLRWVSMRSIKENFLPLGDFSYGHMQ